MWYQGIHEGAALWPFNLFMMTLAEAELIARLASKHKPQKRMPLAGKTTTTTTYHQVVSYLLRTYNTEDDIADTEDKTVMFTQPPNKKRSPYAEELVAKTLRCENVYGKQ